MRDLCDQMNEGIEKNYGIIMYDRIVDHLIVDLESC